MSTPVCDVCGSPARYGSRHSQCGAAVLAAFSNGLKAQSTIAATPQGAPASPAPQVEEKPVAWCSPEILVPDAEEPDEPWTATVRSRKEGNCTAPLYAAPQAETGKLREALESILPMAALAVDYLPAEAVELLDRARAALEAHPKEGV